MKYKKILLVICMLFIMSGCSIKYEIEITKDLNINEKLYIKENNDVFAKVGTTNKIYIPTMTETYRNNDKYKSYEIKEEYNIDQSGITATKNNKTLEEYQLNNGVKKTLFGFIVLKEEKNQITFSATDYRGEQLFNDSDRGDFEYEDVELEIKLPFEVKEHNSDKYDEEKGIYTWYFDKNTREKEVKIVFNKKISLKKQIIRKIKEYWYLLAIIPALLLIGLIMLIRHKRVNKI